MKTTVLVVDDDVAVREALEKVLSQAGHDVVTAADGREAVSRFDLDRIGLLLLDLNLPFKHGWEAFGELSGLDPSVPIIIMTGQPDPNPSALMSGVRALMEKPVDVELLLRTVDELLAESSQSPDHAPNAEQFLRQLHENDAASRQFFAHATSQPAEENRGFA